ncbi:hypothetical protein [Candidatus Paracaedibacter symbiosus]|uniref:hypothetical protein n=1 Tax=Candidatus Paracaedibacter symbiosus TaxID=244582 RepID=UPI0005097E19|nr:hypothetical protein [Candidatus Paracaedibacter symbiosus]
MPKTTTIWLYLTCFYHAAVIKYKENNLVESWKYFMIFFKDIKKFCKTFLDEKEYLYLETKGIFDNSYDNKRREDYDVKQFLYNSTIIFSAIYGPHHPFIQDYVQKNAVF